MMKRQHHTCLAVILLLFSLPVLSQSVISGIWEGNSQKNFLIGHSLEIVVELSLYNDTMLTGTSHLYYKRNKYEHHKLSGKYNPKDSSVIFTEDSVISYDFGSLWDMCEGIYKMKLTKEGKRWKLTGTWKDKKRGLFKCPTVDTWFYKDAEEEDSLVNITDTTIDNDVTGDPGIPGPVITRVEDIQKVIDLQPEEADSIRIDIYDNGLVDNDTVSVYYNDKEVASRQRVSAKPITFYISVDKTRAYQKIRLVAENLGDIPPNTAYMIVTTRKKKYQMPLKSDLQKSAVVELFIMKE